MHKNPQERMKQCGVSISLLRGRGQVFGFSELAGRSFVLESKSVPANFEKSNT
jgi:hypothetical protein